MSTVQSVKNSLKFKTSPKAGLLTVRVGTKKLVIPVSARMASGGDFVFLSFGASSEIYEIKENKLTAMASSADGSEVGDALKPAAKKGGRRKRAGVEMPAALADALKKLPAGTKLVAGPDGGYRLAKKRKRGK